MPIKLSAIKLSNKQEITMPTPEEITMAEESIGKISAYMHSTKEPAIQLITRGKPSAPISVPDAVIKTLVKFLTQIAKGNAVTIIPVHMEITTQQAADLLNVSRPFLVSLLEEGKIPFRRVGTRRRVLAKDVLEYKEAIDKKRNEVLDELVEEAQKHNMGY